MGMEGPDRQKERTDNHAEQQTNIGEDEINLADYLRVIWRRRRFILVVSVLPALIVGLIIFLRPRQYRTTYVYDIGLAQKDYEILYDRFYSDENLDRITSNLEKAGLTRYIRRRDKAKEKIALQVSPKFFEGRRLEAEQIEELRKLQQVKGTLVTITISGRSQEKVEKIATIVRGNFEEVLPMYAVRQSLRADIGQLKADMGEIEGNRFGVELEFNRKKAVLAKLERLEPNAASELRGDIIVQFNDVGKNRDFLPLPYQVQAAKSAVVNLEETMRASMEKYKYKGRLLGVAEMLFKQVQQNFSRAYTLGQFSSFVASAVENYQDPELVDYLRAYQKRLENSVSTYVPVVENPLVRIAPKGTIEKTSLVFVVMFLLTTLAAFVAEGLQRSSSNAGTRP
jgi:hypothetical protein